MYLITESEIGLTALSSSDYKLHHMLRTIPRLAQKATRISQTRLICSNLSPRNQAQHDPSPSSILSNVKNFFTPKKLQQQLALEAREERENAGSPYIQYPLVTGEQMRRICYDPFRFEVGYASFAHHSVNTVPIVHSLSDLTDPTQLNTLLPRRRPHGSPADTLSIKAGDDAMLVSPTVMAIADGVSGWESKGEQCSSGIWARSMLETLSRLMTEYKLSHSPHPLNNRDISQILDDSYLHTSHLMDLQDLNGSSTLILSMLSGETLKYISIGDSKLYVVRNGEMIMTNEEQMADYLCPMQIGTQTLNVLPSEIALVDEVELKPGDIIVMCSDGISDNLYDWEILQALDEYLNFKKDNLRAVANKIVAQCKNVAYDDNAYTPYNEKVSKLPSKRFGRNISLGGKMDDMSLCIARVVPNKNVKK